MTLSGPSLRSAYRSWKSKEMLMSIEREQMKRDYDLDEYKLKALSSSIDRFQNNIYRKLAADYMMLGMAAGEKARGEKGPTASWKSKPTEEGEVKEKMIGMELCGWKLEAIIVKSDGEFEVKMTRSGMDDVFECMYIGESEKDRLVWYRDMERNPPPTHHTWAIAKTLAMALKYDEAHLLKPTSGSPFETHDAAGNRNSGCTCPECLPGAKFDASYTFQGAADGEMFRAGDLVGLDQDGNAINLSQRDREKKKAPKVPAYEPPPMIGTEITGALVEKNDGKLKWIPSTPSCRCTTVPIEQKESKVCDYAIPQPVMWPDPSHDFRGVCGDNQTKPKMVACVVEVPSHMYPRDERKYTGIKTITEQAIEETVRIHDNLKDKARARIARLCEWPRCNHHGVNVSLHWAGSTAFWQCGKCATLLSTTEPEDMIQIGAKPGRLVWDGDHMTVEGGEEYEDENTISITGTRGHDGKYRKTGDFDGSGDLLLKGEDGHYFKVTHT